MLSRYLLLAILLVSGAVLPTIAAPPATPATPAARAGGGPVRFSPLPDGASPPKPLPPDFWTRSEPGAEPGTDEDDEAETADGPPTPEESPAFGLLELLDRGQIDPAQATTLRPRLETLHEEWMKNETLLRRLLTRQQDLDDEIMKLWDDLVGPEGGNAAPDPDSAEVDPAR